MFIIHKACLQIAVYILKRHAKNKAELEHGKPKGVRYTFTIFILFPTSLYFSINPSLVSHLITCICS